MLEMVSLESHRKRNADWKICKNSQSSVTLRSFDSKTGAVCDLVDTCINNNNKFKSAESLL